MSLTTLFLLFNATVATIYMTVVSSLFAILLGMPLGILLFITGKNKIYEHSWLHHSLSFFVNIMRSIPFVILMIAVIPFTRWVVGTSIGTQAAIVPLSLAAMPFIARIVENALMEINPGLIEAATAMGATTWQIIMKVLIPESLPNIMNGLTLTVISLIGYSAMAGAVGGGGLGDVAIRYGYHRFEPGMMLLTLLIMVILVQGVQFLGNKLVGKFTYFK